MGRYPKGKTTMYIDDRMLSWLNSIKEPGETTSHVIWRLKQMYEAKPRRMKV